jgi:hypothetical protein
MSSWTKAQLAARTTYLKSLYEPHFGRLRPNSVEWLQFSRSGSGWDSIYNLRNVASWKLAQQDLLPELHRVDKIRKGKKFGDLTKLDQL